MKPINPLIKIGKTFTSKNCGKFKIVDFEFASEITVRFLETGYEAVVRSDHVLSGCILDPYQRTIGNLGYVGEGIFSRSKTPMVYYRWKNMITRCTPIYWEKKPTYTGCKVSESWECLQAFGADLIKMPHWDDSNYDLDKDILVVGNKLYSKETCLLVHRDVNSLCKEGKRFAPHTVRNVIEKHKSDLPKKVRSTLLTLALVA